MQDPRGDVLTKAVRELLSLNAQHAYQRLVADDPGAGLTAARTQLAALTVETAFSVPVTDRAEASAVLCGLWLWHDFLPECHGIAQGIATRTGSLWHAIMHRREGDFSNSKYWLARARGHQVFSFLEPQVNHLLADAPPEPALLRLIRNGFDPEAFVDLVEQVHHRPADPRHALAVSIQRVEWQALLQYCVRAATA